MNKLKRQKGFTIVELLIVVVVIAILAAITIVAYNGIQNRANDTAVMSDLKSLSTKIEAWKVDNGELYPSAGSGSGTHLGELQFKASKGAYATLSTTENNIWYCRNSTRTQYGVVALAKSGNIFYISERNAAPVQYTGGSSWSSTGINCNTLVAGGLGWQYAGYASSDTADGPWRNWAGGN